MLAVPQHVCVWLCVCVCVRGFWLSHDFCSPLPFWRSVCDSTREEGGIGMMSEKRQNAKQRQGLIFFFISWKKQFLDIYFMGQWRYVRLVVFHYPNTVSSTLLTGMILSVCLLVWWPPGLNSCTFTRSNVNKIAHKLTDTDCGINRLNRINRKAVRLDFKAAHVLVSFDDCSSPYVYSHILHINYCRYNQYDSSLWIKGAIILVVNLLLWWSNCASSFNESLCCRGEEPVKTSLYILYSTVKSEEVGVKACHWSWSIFACVIHCL